MFLVVDWESFMMFGNLSSLVCLEHKIRDTRYLPELQREKGLDDIVSWSRARAGPASQVCSLHGHTEGRLTWFNALLSLL